MPAAVLDRFGPWDGDLVRRLNAAADRLDGDGDCAEMAAGRAGADRARGGERRVRTPPCATTAVRAGTRGPLPPLFSRPFVEVIALAIGQGRLTARRAADLTDMTLEELAELCATHGVDAPFDL